MCAAGAAGTMVLLVRCHCPPWSCFLPCPTPPTPPPPPPPPAWQSMALLLVVGYLYLRIQGFYRPGSRDLKRLEVSARAAQARARASEQPRQRWPPPRALAQAVTRSPIFTHFGESVAGLSTVRAFGEEERFRRLCEANVDTNAACWYYAFAVNRCSCGGAHRAVRRGAHMGHARLGRWLGLRLELVGAFVVLVATSVAVLLQARAACGARAMAGGRAGHGGRQGGPWRAAGRGLRGLCDAARAGLAGSRAGGAGHHLFALPLGQPQLDGARRHCCKRALTHAASPLPSCWPFAAAAAPLPPRSIRVRRVAERRQHGTPCRCDSSARWRCK